MEEPDALDGMSGSVKVLCDDVKNINTLKVSEIKNGIIRKYSYVN